jgi:hypothetical protein
MFKLGDIVKISREIESGYDYQSYVLCALDHRYNPFSSKEVMVCVLSGVEDDKKVEVWMNYVNIDESYYRKQKIEKICSRLGM